MQILFAQCHKELDCALDQLYSKEVSSLQMCELH
jgi:hypothetical protein